MMDLLAATKNKGKIKEIDRLIKESPLDVNVYSLDDFNIFADCPETGDTFLDNSIEKSLFYSRLAADIYTAADDSGLAVDALGGKPGVHSARGVVPQGAGVRGDGDSGTAGQGGFVAEKE